MKNRKTNKLRLLKNGFTFIMIFLSCSFVFANEKDNKSSGQITYEIKYEDLSVKYFLFKALLPKQSVSVYNKENYKQKTLSSYLSITMYSDVKNRSVSFIMNADGSKFHLKLSFETYKDQLNMRLHDEYKTIKGFKCRKATYTDKDKTVTIYYTTDLHTNNPVLVSNNIQGCVLEKISYLKNDGGISIMTVNDIQFKSIDSNEFELPIDVKTYTNREDFEKAIDEME